MGDSQKILKYLGRVKGILDLETNIPSQFMSGSSQSSLGRGILDGEKRPKMLIKEENVIFVIDI